MIKKYILLFMLVPMLSFAEENKTEAKAAPKTEVKVEPKAEVKKETVKPEPSQSDAEPEAAKAETPVEAPRPIESQFNYFGLGVGLYAVSSGGGSEGYLYYGRRLSSQFVLGGRFGGISSDVEGQGEGTSSNGQYYRDHKTYKSTTVELDGTYFFRKDGYRKFGFLTRAGVGFEDGEMSGFFKRYDDDPGLIQIGDGKRLQQIGDTKEVKFTRGFIRIEPAFQFLWAPKGGTTIGGHTLELATSFLISQASPSTSYTRPDGKEIVLAPPKLISAFQVSYIIIF